MLIVTDPGVQADQQVTRFQARAALLQAGLLDTVDAAIAQSDVDSITQLAWADAVSFKRHSPMILEMATRLGLSDAQVDALFVAAEGIE